MKNLVLRILALVLVFATLIMALPITASAASYSSRCRHSRTKNTTYKTVYEESTATEHIKIRYRKEVCKSCDKVLERWTEEKTQDHDFNNGVCEDCGYERSIADLLEDGAIIVWKNGSKTVYVGNQKTKWDYAPKNINGTTMVPLTIATEVLGGEYLYWDSDTNSAYIEINNQEVRYQKNSKNYWVNGKRNKANEKAQIIDGKLYVELKTLAKRNKQDVDYKDGYVFISNDGVSSKEMKQIIDYLYNGKEDDAMLDNIKAGNVYATSADGKHIYKRTYDASKSCKYTDVYVCTIFNIELPKSAVLTLDGNYLYVNGKKAFADVDTLQTADKRISQLNRIIDGASNAYSNKVISKTRRNSIRNTANASIAEYEDVAKGIKALSCVSEVKKSYTAKVGDKNNTVENIQQKLYDLGYTSQLVTGYYGDITFNNVAYFQIVNGLTVTGWVDSTTYSKINEQFETPYAYVENVDVDRDGIMLIHTLGNESTVKLFVEVSGNNFYKTKTINDCEDWFVVETPKSGEYNIIVTAYTKAGKKYVSEKLKIDVVKYNWLQKTFEDMSEDYQIRDEIYLGLFTAVAENTIIKPAVSMANALDYVYNYPSTYQASLRAEARNEYVKRIERSIEEGLPYGANYYYAGQAIGDVVNIGVDTVLIVNGVKSIVTGVKTLSGGISIITAQVVNATTGTYETIQIVVDSVAVQASATQALTGTMSFAIAVASGSPSDDWEDVDVVDEDVNEKTNSDKLKRNMEKTGRYKPSTYSTATHHIVAGGSHNEDAVASREILKKFGIGVNNEANGVYLPTQKGVINSAYHPSLHTKEYYAKVYEFLSRATSREDAIAILRDIAEQLSQGIF